MGKVIVSQFITVDGVAEDPGGAEGFDRGGWAFRYERGAEGDKFKLDEVMGADALLLGRTTYEGFARAWPEREGEFADKFNGMPKYVVSSTLTDPSWSNTTVLEGGDLAARVREVAGRHGGSILVNGSLSLCRALLEHGLADEWRLMVFPTVLGAGKRLFGDTSAAASLALTAATPAGQTLITIYKPAAA